MMDTKDLCMALMRADTEDEVVGLLTTEGYWNAPEYWRLLGGIENNYATIGNQQGEAIAALVEKIVNSIDARLIDACLRAGVHPESELAPTSIRQAVAQFFEGTSGNSDTAGRIFEWLDAKTTEEGRLLTVTATGLMPKDGNPSITIADQGEGQTPDDFPNTFMSLTRSNKLRIPFVQGKYNMGGTGALRFCGTHHSLQLIVSRRNPLLTRVGPHGREQQWGFTVVRRESPRPGMKSSVFTYLAPHVVDSSAERSVLSFSADSWPIFPESNNQMRDAYCRNAPHGTLVKLYEYNWQGTKSNVVLSGGGLLSRINVGLPETALPVRLFECRAGYGGHSGSFATNALGLFARLERDKADNLEVEPFGGVTSLAGRQLSLMIYLFAPGRARSYRTHKHGVVFTINGQMHGSLSADFFRKSSVNMSYLADSLLVLVDCTDIDGRLREDLFMNSRDRLSVNPISDDLENDLASFLKNNPKLKKLRNQRQEALAKKRLEDDKPLIEALRSALKSDPTLSRLLLEGLEISSPFPFGGGAGKGKQGGFVGKRFPTFFRFAGRETGETLERDAHEGSRVRVAFETDAADDYFSRRQSPGSWRVQRRLNGHLSDASNWSTTDPNSGVAQLWLHSLPEGSRSGDDVEYLVSVTDSNRLDAFANTLRLHVKGPQHSGKGGGGKLPVSNVGEGETGSDGGLSLPRITTVRKPDWSDHDFTEESVLRIYASATDQADDVKRESSSYDFFINVDNKYLGHEQKTSPRNSDLIEKQFTYGMVIVGLALLRRDAQSHNGKSLSSDTQADTESKDQQIERTVSVTTAALAPVFLPMLKVIGNLVNEGI